MPYIRTSPPYDHRIDTDGTVLGWMEKLLDEEGNVIGYSCYETPQGRDRRLAASYEEAMRGLDWPALSRSLARIEANRNIFFRIKLCLKRLNGRY